MNKRIIIPVIAVVVLALIAGTVLAITYSNNKESAREQNAAENNTRAPQDTVTTDSPDESAPVAGAYIDYSDSVIADTRGEKVLFFHAPWCPQCRQIDSEIKAQASLPANTTLIKVDYDSHQDLRQKYGVTLQTTFVKVGDDGNEIEKYVAYNEPTYAAVKENILE